MSKPLVSIIINSHNNLEYLPETIDSALAQTYPHYEIILYDNASTQDLTVLKETYGDKIDYYRSDTFLTLGQARNQALKYAKGEIIDYLDSDDLFHPQKLEKLVPFFEDPKVGLVLCNTYFFRIHSDGQKEERLMYSEPLKDGEKFHDLLEDYNLSFVATMFRKSCIGEDPSDWFPEQFNICTDFELFLRISHRNLVKYLHEPLCSWRITGENWSIKKKYLTPLEQLMMVPMVKKYEPELFEKHKGLMNGYFSNVHSEIYHYYWQEGYRREAFLGALHSFFLGWDFKHLVKAFLIPFMSWSLYKTKLKKEAI